MHNMNRYDKKWYGVGKDKENRKLYKWVKKKNPCWLKHRLREIVFPVLYMLELYVKREKEEERDLTGKDKERKNHRRRHLWANENLMEYRE